MLIYIFNFLINNKLNMLNMGKTNIVYIQVAHNTH